MSPAVVAASISPTTRAASSSGGEYRCGRASCTRRRAREAICRQASGVFPTVSAISLNGTSNTSARMNTTRSTGFSVSSTWRNPIVSDEDNSTISSGPGRDRVSGSEAIGSGSHGPT